jgi:hypothetical protein
MVYSHTQISQYLRCPRSYRAARQFHRTSKRRVHVPCVRETKRRRENRVPLGHVHEGSHGQRQESINATRAKHVSSDATGTF